MQEQPQEREAASTRRRDFLKLAGTLPLAASPAFVAAQAPAPAGAVPGITPADRVFITNEDSNTVVVIDPGRNVVDTTINLTAQNKVSILQGWVKQWQEAIDQGNACEMQGNKLVSPLHDTLKQQVPTPDQGGAVCGYFYKPGEHTGDVA